MRVLFVVLFALGCQTASADDLNSSTPEARRYRFGLEWGCYDKGDKHGDSRAQLDQTCGCMMSEIDQRVPVDQWHRAFVASSTKDTKAERAIMSGLANDFRAAAEICKAKAQRPESEAGPPHSPPKIEGTWRWTRPENNCSEVYEYSPAGTVRVTSGEEIAENTYRISEVSNSSRYKVEMTMTSENGERDCTGSTTNNTGKTSETYVFISPAAGAMAVCNSAKEPKCFGPLLRD